MQATSMHPQDGALPVKGYKMSNFFSVAGGIYLTETSFMVLAFLILGLPFIIMSIMGVAEVYHRIRKHFGYEETGNITLPELLEKAAAKSNETASASTSTSTQ
jgi:hypothetical protein